MPELKRLLTSTAVTPFSQILCMCMRVCVCACAHVRVRLIAQLIASSG
jgi:hypothetical protein